MKSKIFESLEKSKPYFVKSAEESQEIQLTNTEGNEKSKKSIEIKMRSTEKYRNND